MSRLIHDLARHKLADLGSVRLLPLWVAERHHAMLVDDVREEQMARAAAENARNRSR